MSDATRPPNIGDLDAIVGKLTHLADEIDAIRERRREQAARLFEFAKMMHLIRHHASNVHEDGNSVARAQAEAAEEER